MEMHWPNINESAGSDGMSATYAVSPIMDSVIISLCGIWYVYTFDIKMINEHKFIELN